MKEFHVKEPLHIFLYKMKEMSEFCKSVKLGRFKRKEIVRSYVYHFTLVHKNASNCSKMSMKMIRRYYDIIK